jgi:muramidase (phage lysozyme)
MNRLANLKAFLDLVAFSEIGPRLLNLSDNGYDVCVGSTPTNPILFDSYAAHPRRRSAVQNSDAAGRYQFMGRYWEAYRDELHLPDFGPESQDKWATQLIKECHAYDDVCAGRIAQAIEKCRSRWASFPGAGYGQPEQKLDKLLAAYQRAGGGLAP